jgi:hypothetical protein
MAQATASHKDAEYGVTNPSTTKEEQLGKSAEDPHLKKSEPLPAGEEDDEGKVYPPARKVAAVMVALYLSLFLVSLVSPYVFLLYNISSKC